MRIKERFGEDREYNPTQIKVTIAPDEYSPFDTVLMPWAKRRGITVETDDRGWNVRSIWVHDRNGNHRAQMWLERPDGSGNVIIKAGFLDPNSPTKWGPVQQGTATMSDLEEALEELWTYMVQWGGPGAFT